MKKPQPGDLVWIWTDPCDRVFGRYVPDFVVARGDDERIRSTVEIPYKSCALCVATRFVHRRGTSSDFYLFVIGDRLLWLCDLEAEFDVVG